jgi:hypothetical protein
MKDFRDHVVEKALDKAVGPYRPEQTRRSRFRRIAIVVALTLAVVAAFWTILHLSAPNSGARPAKPRPVPVELLPAPARKP